MTDIFTLYETGLTQLLERLGSDHSSYTDALTLQSRLLENMAQAQQYGDTETRRAERAQIVDRLNRLALKTVGMSFSKWCRLTQEESAPTIPIELSQAPTMEPADEIAVEPGKKVAIRASAVDADGYEWQLQGDGEISATTGPAILYNAPEEGDTIAVLTVTAYNDQGASPPTSLVINVLPIATAAVRLDSLAIPAGWMSGGTSPATFISLERGNEAICHTGADCLRITYRPGGVWGGIYWWPLDCGETGTDEAWDKVTKGTCGINVLEAGNLTAVNRLAFWARGEQGGEVVEFKIGAADILPSPGRSLGKVTLARDWNPYEIDLRGMDLANAVSLFAWVASDVDNPEGAVFYLDDIQFEGVR